MRVAARWVVSARRACCHSRHTTASNHASPRRRPFGSANSPAFRTRAHADTGSARMPAESTMKEAIVHPDLRVDVVDSPIPTPGDNELLIKVEVSGSNPKDWKFPQLFQKSMNAGDDLAGTVSSIGTNVTGFHPGDRVLGYHVAGTPHGSYAEYAIVREDLALHLGKGTSFEEAATVPLAAMTAAVALFVRLGLPEPWQGGREDGKVPGFRGKVVHGEEVTSKDVAEASKPRAGPLLVYGAASAVGAFAIQLAKRAGIGPIIGVAGGGIPMVQRLLTDFGDQRIAADEGDVGVDKIVDYRNGDQAVIDGIKAAIPKGQELKYTLDAVSEKNSYVNASKAMASPGSKMAVVLPSVDLGAIRENIETIQSGASDVSRGVQSDFGYAWMRLLGKGLKEEWLKGHPWEVVPGGLAGIQGALKDLKDGKVSAKKFVFRIADTPGVGA